MTSQPDPIRTAAETLAQQLFFDTSHPADIQTIEAAFRQQRAEAEQAMRVVQNAAKVLVKASERRELDARKHEPQARRAIATLESELEANAQLTTALETAEAECRTLRAERDAAIKHQNLNAVAGVNVAELLQAAEARIAELETALREVTADMDWAGGDNCGMPECPWCRSGPDGDNHRADCELVKARAALKGSR